MNLVVMMGRLTRDPEVRYSVGSSGTTMANFRIAVDRRFKREGQQDADFFDCVAFGKQAEFVEKYIHKGTKVVVSGSMQNDNYQGRDGQMVYRNRIVLDNIEFAESKAASGDGQSATTPTPAQTPVQTPAPTPTSTTGAQPPSDFGDDDEELPFV